MMQGRAGYRVGEVVFAPLRAPFSRGLDAGQWGISAARRCPRR